MPNYEALDGTSLNHFQVGLPGALGPQLINNTGVLESRTSALALNITRGAPAVGLSDYVTLAQLAAVVPVVTGIVFEVRFPFTIAAFTDSATVIPAGAQIITAQIEIVTPFSALATVKLGEALGVVDLFLLSSENEPQTVAIYGKEQDTAGTNKAVRVTVGGLPLAGAGVAIVRYAVPFV